ncbi:MAG: SDR family oxidoreductase [Desulfobacteraceae bacterium]|nr:SDR family oxidoreductase [Desulfobacteraceae bacterium]
MTIKKFLNKVVLVTGGASGIGLATCHEFARAGAKIAMLDMDEQMLISQKQAFQKSGYEILTLACDVTDAGACQKAVETVISQYGAIDILFNNAGITQRGLFENTKVSVIEKVMTVNFYGSLYMTKAALPSLIKQKGMIIVNESIAGVAPLLGRCAYSASKHALHGLFTSLRCEMKSRGVHVMIICPGFIKTNLQTRALGCDGKITTRQQTRVGKQQTPEFLARKIVFGAEKKFPMMVFTLMGKIGYLISRLAPSVYERLMTRQFQKELEE